MKNRMLAFLVVLALLLGSPLSALAVESHSARPGTEAYVLPLLLSGLAVNPVGTAVALSCHAAAQTWKTPAEEPVLNVCNWGMYINEDVLRDFELQTGVRIHYQIYDNSLLLDQLLRSEPGRWDVVFASDYMVDRLIQAEMLAPLEHSLLPNTADIDPALRGQPFDPESAFSVPYFWGTMGLIYNTSMIPTPEDSWGEMFDEENQGKVLMPNYGRDALGIALKYQQRSYNTDNSDHWKEAARLLRNQAPLVRAYADDETWDLMVTGKGAICGYYAPEYLFMREENPDLAYCIPKEGGVLFVDSMCIPKTAPHKEYAHQFINMMCSTKAGLANCLEVGYATPLLSVREALPPEALDPVLYPDEETLARCEVYLDLPASVWSQIESEWLALRST